MKVMITSQGYPTDKYPMHGIHQFSYAKALKKNGFDVYVVALDLRSFRRKRKWGFEEKIVEGIKVYAVNIPLGNINQKKLCEIGAFFLNKYLDKILEKENGTEIIHSHLAETSYSFIKSLKKKGYKIPIVATEHYSTLNKDSVIEIRKDYYEVAKYVYSNVSEVLVGSPVFQSRIYKNFGVNPICTPIVTNTEEYKVVKENFDEEGYRIVSTGNLKKDKGFRELINAFAIAFKDKRATLNIFGEGPDKSYLQELIKELSLQDKVFLRGFKSKKDLAKEYNDSNLFVLASYTETFGKVYIEAMCCGLPVITTNNGGSEQFIEEFNGIIANKGDIKDLANKLILMYNNRYKFEKTIISDYAESNFSETASINELKKIYSAVLKGEKYAR
ncbi:glycosyltransferase [Miniphocaeibacter massiliensis]|uniref:glycosyltransferase n=1 Tax=Miniphocaeibacter massiliensis TaxID=2041841 RepID=UPI000C1BC12C|nr:glycosyltransferase [Miniphocaeibacter massiliensis]